MRSLPLASPDHLVHLSFIRTAPYLRAALLLGCGGGFAFACVLTLAPLVGVPIGSWWAALVQAHGQLQLFGWAGLFVIGVIFYFVPRLRGKALAWPALLPWILGLQVASLLLRGMGQPLLVGTGWMLWKVVLVLSGILEVLAVLMILLVLARTLIGKSAAKSSLEGIRSIAPFLIGAFLGLALAGLLNLFNCLAALADSGLVPATGDQVSIMLGLFGFLIPMALAMSTRMLPLYARLQPFPTPLLWLLSLGCFAGLLCWLLGLLLQWMSFTSLNGLGPLVVGIVMLLFIGYFLYLLRNQEHLPRPVTSHSQQQRMLVERARIRKDEGRRRYGPYMKLIGSAYLWAALGGMFLVIDGCVSLLFGILPVALDAIRHSFAVGFITLLICGMSVRLVPDFSSKMIRSPRLVTTTLILGNLAALLRVGPLLVPALPFSMFFFALSGPIGLALILCLTVNLWPAL